MKGWVLSIIIEENLFMLEFFKTFRVGLAAINDLLGGSEEATAMMR